MTQAPRIAALTLMAAAVAAGQSTPADAQIRCEGRFQVIQGSLHSTPWCEDAYLTAVAREYGMRVDPKAVRNDPGVKAQVCRFVGRDGRVRDICTGYLNEGRRGWPP
jgi:hypothetical protein